MHDHVIIIGAGPIGLCLALALARRGMTVDLVERQAVEALAEPPFDGREIALTHASMRVLQDLDVWRQIPADGIAPVSRACIRDGGRPGFDVDGAVLDRPRIGVLVSNHLIRAAAWRAVAGVLEIRVHTGVAVEGVRVDANAASAVLADGRVFEGALLVAADSRFSETRRMLGIPAYLHDFGLSMLLCRVRHETANAGVAWEWFGHGQTRALLPLGERLASVVLTVPGAEARALRELAPEAFAADIAQRYEGRLGGVQLASTRHCYPLVATFARRFAGPRWALAGDAAVGMHPVTAHGFNLGVSSIERLAAATGTALRRCRDAGHPSGLTAFQRQHRREAAPLFAGTEAVARLFTDERRLAQPLRHAVIGLGRHLPPLRRALAVAVLDQAPRPLSVRDHLRLARAVLRPRGMLSHAGT